MELRNVQGQKHAAKEMHCSSVTGGTAAHRQQQYEVQNRTLGMCVVVVKPQEERPEQRLRLRAGGIDMFRGESSPCALRQLGDSYRGLLFLEFRVQQLQQQRRGSHKPHGNISAQVHTWPANRALRRLLSSLKRRLSSARLRISGSG